MALAERNAESAESATASIERRAIAIAAGRVKNAQIAARPNADTGLDRILDEGDHSHFGPAPAGAGLSPINRQQPQQNSRAARRLDAVARGDGGKRNLK